MDYESQTTLEAQSARDVRYTISRMSFGRRLELTRKVRELGRRLEFLGAGKNAEEKMEESVLTAEIDRLFLEWGLRRVEGLFIDGQPATAETVIEHGPEELCQEILKAIKAECGLSEAERKN